MNDGLDFLLNVFLCHLNGFSIIKKYHDEVHLASSFTKQMFISSAAVQIGAACAKKLRTKCCSHKMRIQSPLSCVPNCTVEHSIRRIALNIHKMFYI